MFQNLEAITSAYVEAAQYESKALFAQGDILAQAVADGFSIREVAKHCAGLTRRKTRTVYNRYKVATVFPPEKRNPQLDWYLHLVCASTDNPDAWLAKAADEDMSSRDLEAAIKANGGDPDKDKPVYLLKDAEAYVYEDYSISGQGFTVLVLLEDGKHLPFDPATLSAPVLITIVQPAPEVQAPATEELPL